MYIVRKIMYSTNKYTGTFYHKLINRHYLLTEVLFVIRFVKYFNTHTFKHVSKQYIYKLMNFLL